MPSCASLASNCAVEASSRPSQERLEGGFSVTRRRDAEIPASRPPGVLDGLRRSFASLRRRLPRVACSALLALAASVPSTAAVIVSGADRGVTRTTVAADPSGRRVVVMWESKQFAAHEHLRLNRSTDGGMRWRPEPLDFALNVVNPWFSDYLPEIALDRAGDLHVLWSQRSDTTSPVYARSADVGDTWPTKTPIGGGNLPRWYGIALSVGPEGQSLWSFHHDTNWRAYACGSSDGGRSWAVLAEHAGGYAAGDPEQGYCSDAVAFADRRHVLRQRGGALEVLTCRGEAWSACALPGGNALPSLAADHTLAVDDEGRLFAVYAAAGQVHCARSDDAGRTFSLQTAVTAGDPGEPSRPVVACRPAGVVVAWQETAGEASQIRYAVSAEGGQSFGPPQPLDTGGGAQAAPDLCAIGDTLYFSYTRDGQAAFARVPEAPAEAATATDRSNLLPDPGFSDFDGAAPRGWIATSWNQEFLQERFGRCEPGRDGTGSCLELAAGSGASIIHFTGPAVATQGDADYFLKGYYASTCERVSLKGEWFDEAGKTVRSFELRLPETQDGWVHFIQQLWSPALASQLRLSIEKKWQSGRVRFDDFSLRRGTVADYASEFALPDPASPEPWFPIFSWLGPYAWPQLGPEMTAQLDRDEYHLDYALAGFNVGYRAKFGLRYHFFPGPPADDGALAKAETDPALWVYHGGDEPSESAFAGIATQAQSLRDRGAKKPLWYNLLPTYGFKSYADYEHHVRAYLETVKPTFVTYDHYCLSGGNKAYGRDFFANLEIVRRQAQVHAVDWGVILQLVAFGGMRGPDEAELRWQAFTSLAYGAQAIGWFTYLTEVEYGGFNWRDAVVDREGFRTRHYSMLMRVNGDIARLGKTLIGLKSTGAFHTEPVPELASALSAARLVQSAEGGPLVLGEFADASGAPYLMVVNRDFTAPVSAKLTLRQPAASVREVGKATGEMAAFSGHGPGTDALVVTLAPGDGVLLRLGL